MQVASYNTACFLFHSSYGSILHLHSAAAVSMLSRLQEYRWKRKARGNDSQMDHFGLTHVSHFNWLNLPSKAWNELAFEVESWLFFWIQSSLATLVHWSGVSLFLFPGLTQCWLLALFGTAVWGPSPGNKGRHSSCSHTFVYTGSLEAYLQENDRPSEITFSSIIMNKTC